jgi:rSAM/selenodomain-associated transferase 2
VISIIIPARNEAASLSVHLQALQGLRAQGHELIVVDGQSSDDTPAQASAWADQTLSSPAGRAVQMNLGAAHARGEVLLFLHADSTLPEQADQLIEAALQQRHWGRFDVRLSGRHWLLRVVERMMNWRSCLSGMATGDQGIFLSRATFEKIGGYPELPLMEDLALSKRLRRQFGWPACIHQPLITSSRRWEQHGILRTILLMWTLRLAWFLGVPAERLAARYRRSDPPVSP